MWFEGYSKGSLSYNNHNPGNLKFVGQPGATDKDQFGHAIFESFEAGYDALVNQLLAAALGRYPKLYQPEMSLRDFYDRYATVSTNYADFVARQLGVSPNIEIMELI
jgi:hypothetical protein